MMKNRFNIGNRKTGPAAQNQMKSNTMTLNIKKIVCADSDLSQTPFSGMKKNGPKVPSFKNLVKYEQ